MNTKHLLLIAAVIALLAPTPGCNQAQIAELQLKATELKAQLAAGRKDLELTQEQRARLAAAIAEMPEGPEKEKAKKLAKNVDAAIEKTSAFLVKLEEATLQMEQRLEGAEDALDVAEAAVESAAPLIPAPWGAIFAASGGLLIGLLRAGYNRAQAVKIARSVDGKVDLSDASKAEIRAIQGAGGGRIVDEAQGKATRLPF